MSRTKKRPAPKLFFSHSSNDAELLKLFVKAARMGFSLSAEAIRFSSEEAYGFEPGQSITESAIKECTEATVLIGVLTPNSLKSGWVKTELDARLGATVKNKQKPSYLVIANGAKFDAIPSPHQDKLAQNCTETGLEHLFRVIGKKLRKTYDFETAREYLKEAETYSKAMEDALDDRPGDSLSGHEATAEVSFESPTNGAIEKNPVHFSVTCQTLPAGKNALWLCVEIDKKVWPKQPLPFKQLNEPINGHVAEGGESRYFFFTVVEVGPKGQKQIDDWQKKGEEKGGFPGIESLKGALVDFRLVIKK